jgi:hypothetical protein
MSTKDLRKLYRITTLFFSADSPVKSVSNRLFSAASSCRRFSLQVAPPYQPFSRLGWQPRIRIFRTFVNLNFEFI